MDGDEVAHRHVYVHCAGGLRASKRLVEEVKNRKAEMRYYP
jgi:hypothetical protein